MTQLDDPSHYTAYTSALIIYISNIQRAQKESVFMYFNNIIRFCIDIFNSQSHTKQVSKAGFSLSVSENTRPGNDRTEIVEIKLHSEEEGGERNRHGTQTPLPLGRLGLSDRILLLGQMDTAETRGGKKYKMVFFLFRKIRVSVFMATKG